MQGPDLTNSLVGVLLRFRQAPVAFTADIESMFYQVRVPSDQRDFLQFLWWPEGNLSNEIEEYQMNVHIFGAVSSPSCANFCLKQAADDSEIDIGTETCNVVMKTSTWTIVCDQKRPKTRPSIVLAVLSKFVHELVFILRSSFVIANV